MSVILSLVCLELIKHVSDPLNSPLWSMFLNSGNVSKTFFVIHLDYYSDQLSSLQVRSDYMQYHASKVSDGMALQLGCLEIR